MNRYSYGLGCMVVDDFMTIRRCIELMRKYGTSKVVLNNGTKIFIHEINCRQINEPIGRIKWNPDGSVKVIRRIFCSIDPSSKTKMLDELRDHRNKEGGNGKGYRDYWLWDSGCEEYQFFNENDFVLPERVMNEFIRSNGCIDEYETIQVPAYMYDDMMSLCGILEDE